MAYNSPKWVPRGGGQVTAHVGGMNQRQGKDKDTASGWMSSTQQTNNLAKQKSLLAGLRRQGEQRMGTYRFQ